jgi:hypothetical protein
MSDPNELGALKSSMRGVLASAAELRPLAERVEAIDPHQDVAESDLDDLHRLTLAHAVAAQALRGLVETMMKRRGKLAAVAAIETGGEE